jgi:RNA-directed DNA polymerase
MSSWAPHSLRASGNAKGFDSAYIENLIAEGQRLKERGLPPLFTLGHLAVICDVPYAFLRAVVSRAIDPYRVFRLRKKAGGFRRITVPSYPLNAVQGWLHTTVLKGQKVHSSSQAFNEGCSPLKNAASHCGAKWLIKVDLKNFFESISERQVYRVFREMGFPALISFELGRICTRVCVPPPTSPRLFWQLTGRYSIASYCHTQLGHLPQGAATSPLLANLVCHRFDEQLNALAMANDCTYTRYADDIVFSAQSFSRTRALGLISRVDRISEDFGFRRNGRKTVIAPPGARRVVTGLLVDGAEVRLTKNFRERLELHLYHALKAGVAEHCRRRKFASLIGFMNHLDGLITYAEHVEPRFGSKCRMEFARIDWRIIGDFGLLE